MPVKRSIIIPMINEGDNHKRRKRYAKQSFKEDEPTDEAFEVFAKEIANPNKALVVNR